VYAELTNSVGGLPWARLILAELVKSGVSKSSQTAHIKSVI
jgi:hypothetical protein